jgi:hypothetical protein
VKDATGDPAYGRTSWRRFAVAVGVPTVVAGVMIAGVAQGAIAASFTVSGQSFKISADRLDGTGFAQYGAVQYKQGPNDSDGNPTKIAVPVAMSGIHDAHLTNLCQSVVVPNTPWSLTIHAGNSTDKDKQAHATDLLIGVDELTGQATFDHIAIGQDASTLTKGGEGAKGSVNLFGQEADGVIIDDLHQTAYSTTAGTFTLPGLDLKINLGQNGKPVECF